MTGDAAPVLDARDWADAGHRVVLATVTRTWGSSPRPEGSQLAVADDGRFTGSVSAGCVEGAVIQAAAAFFDTADGPPEPALLEYGVTDEDAWAVGLSCGGQMQLLLGPVPAGVIREVAEAVEAKRSAVLALPMPPTADDSDAPPPADPSPDESSPAALTPLVLHEADLADPDNPVAKAAAGALAADRPEVVATGAGALLLRPFGPPERVVVVGAVHTARALVPMVAGLGWEVVVVDPRSAFAREELFPDARVVRGWPREALAELGLDRRTAVVTLTHDAKVDDPALGAALDSDAFYIGALGSRRTHARRLERLAAAGRDDDALARIHGPVGLDIGARTPEEIAVSILAEIVAARRSAGPARRSP